MADEEKKDEGAEEAVKKKDGGDAGDGAPKGPNQKLIFGVLALNSLVLIALCAVVWITYKKSASQVSLSDIAAAKDGATHDPKAEGGGEAGKDGKGKDDKAAGNKFFKESFTVNLSGGGGAHFAKLDVEIEVDDDFVMQELERLKPKIRDFILVILSSKTYEQIESTDGREFLREEIRNQINGYLVKGKIKSVYFTQLIVQ